MVAQLGRTWVETAIIHDRSPVFAAALGDQQAVLRRRCLRRGDGTKGGEGSGWHTRGLGIAPSGRNRSAMCLKAHGHTVAGRGRAATPTHLVGAV